MPLARHLLIVMSSRIQSRIENAVAAYLRASIADAPGSPFYRVPVTVAQSAGQRQLPAIILYAESAREHEDFPSGFGVYAVALRVYVLTQADDEPEDVHDQRVAVITALMADVAALRAAVNASIDPLIESQRPVQGLHIYDASEAEFEDGRDERHHGDNLQFNVLCQAADGAPR